MIVSSLKTCQYNIYTYEWVGHDNSEYISCTSPLPKFNWRPLRMILRDFFLAYHNKIIRRRGKDSVGQFLHCS